MLRRALSPVLRRTQQGTLLGRRGAAAAAALEYVEFNTLFWTSAIQDPAGFVGSCTLALRLTGNVFCRGSLPL